MPRVAKYEENDEPIAGYRLVGFLGQGQFGEVWKAIESTTGKFVAIKIIDLSHSNSALKELKALNLVKNLNHPHLIPIFTARLKDKNGREIPLHRSEEFKGKGVLRELIIAMGLGDKSLSARLKEINPDGTDPADFKGLPVDELLGYMQGAAKGIDFLNKADHGLGLADGPIVHCDIKPDNMMIVAGEVQIVDCGVAVIITPDVRQTKAAGSPAYSAPELTGNKPVPGTDQYALAISYYELRSGHLPFDEQMGQLSIMLAHAEGRLDFGSPILTEEEVRVLRWATSVRPKERYPTCFDMVKQLERAIEGIPPLEPSRIGVKSSVISTPKSRKSAPPLDPTLLRSTPNLPQPEPRTPVEQKPEGVVSFELPAPRTLPDELRGTDIPHTERIIVPGSPGFTLPVPEPTATQAEIAIPLEGLELISEQDIESLPSAPPVAEQHDDSPAAEYTRPQINVDGDDPLGAKAKTIELDPEIARIIKGSPVATRPASPLAQAVKTQVQQVAEPAAMPETGQRSTEYPRETPAEEEAKSLPPWMKEARAAEQERNRASSQSLLTGTNWKVAESEAGSGLAAKLLIGGVLVAGIAGGGAYFSGLLGGKGSSNASQGDPLKNTEEQNPKTGPGTETAKVDSAKIKVIDDLIDKNTLADLGLAEAELGKLPNNAVYESERKRLTDKIATARQALSKPDPSALLKTAIEEIDGLIRMAEREANPAVAKQKLDEAENRIASLLPVDLPEPYKSKRKDWKAQIDNRRTAIKLPTTNREFQMVLEGLDKESETDIKAAAKVAIDRYINSPVERKQLGHKLVSIGENKKTHRDAIILILLEGERFSLLLDDKDREAVVGWRTKEVRSSAESLRGLLNALATGNHPKDSKTVLSALSAVEKLKEQHKLLAMEFGTNWSDKYIPDDLGQFLALASVWYDARKGLGDGIKPLRERVHSATPPDLALPLALEYLRLGTERSESIAHLRTARNATREWVGLDANGKKRIDDLFQSALALRVRDDLTVTVGKPRWADILKLCESDAALGWKSIVEAEQKLETGGNAGPIASVDTEDATRAERTALATYLECVSKRDLDSAKALDALFETPVPIVSASFRKVRVAAVLATHAITTLKTVPKPEAILSGTWKPYAANPQSLRFLKKARELDGSDRSDWVMHLYFLAEASNDRDTARSVANRVKVDEAKATSADLALALAFYRSRSEDPGVDQTKGVEAHAIAARLAYRLMDLTFEPDEDALIREKKLLPEIQKLADKGLKLSGGNDVDQVSLKFSALRPKILLLPPITKDWINAVLPGLNEVVDKLPNAHPDYAEAKAYRAFVTLMRFGAKGDLFTEDPKESNSQQRLRAWDEMTADAEEAAQRDPACHYAQRVLAFATFSRFKSFSYLFPPPTDRQFAGEYFANRETVEKLVERFKIATTTLGIRKNTVLWMARSSFLFVVASDFAKAGQSAETIRGFLNNAALSAEKADKQRTTQRIDEPRLLGCIREDLAWLGQESPANNYEQAIAKLLVAVKRPRSTPEQLDQYFIALGDRGRCIVRGVRSGVLPKERLGDAESALDELEAEAAKLPPALMTVTIQAELAKAKYWRGMRHLANDNWGAAAQSFADASNALKQPYIADLYALSLVHAAEAALADRQKTKENALQVVDDSIRLLTPAAQDAQAAMSFVPDYLKARRALANGDNMAAKAAFGRAFNILKRAWDKKTLRVEDPFALHCLAYEILTTDHSPEVIRTRKELLGDFEKAFAWSMTPSDRKLVADAMKK